MEIRRFASAEGVAAHGAMLVKNTDATGLASRVFLLLVAQDLHLSYRQVTPGNDWAAGHENQLAFM